MRLAFQCILALVAVIVPIATFIQLRALRQSRASLVGSVGIRELDNGLRFQLGVFRLAFGSHAADLPSRTKWLLRAYALENLGLFVFGVYVLARSLR